jgi:hypothetical protein
VSDSGLGLHRCFTEVSVQKLWDGSALTRAAAPIALIRTTRVGLASVHQSSQPASTDFPSVAKVARDEAMHIAGDFAKTISGGQTAEDHADVAKVTHEKQGHSRGMSEDFVSFHSLGVLLGTLKL